MPPKKNNKLSEERKEELINKMKEQRQKAKQKQIDAAKAEKEAEEKEVKELKPRKRSKTKRCETCGFVFEFKTKNQKYCQTSCRKSKKRK